MKALINDITAFAIITMGASLVGISLAALLTKIGII